MPRKAAQGIALTIGERVRQYRTARGWGAKELAERCVDAGLQSWNRNVVMNLEHGRRAGIDVDELLVLARVLAVPPVLLMLPLGESDEVELMPGWSGSTWQAVRWFVGDRPEVPGVELQQQAGDRGAWLANAAPLALYRDFEKLMGDVRRELNAAALAAADEQQVDRKRLVRLLERLGALLDDFAAAGVRSPAVPAPVVELLVSMGMVKRPDAIRRGDGEQAA